MTTVSLTTAACPSWVAPSPSEPGSLDALGYQLRADRIAETLLPGVTVQTHRARYLSFLCWAIDRTGGNEIEIDRWEIALAVGEHLRHSGTDHQCSFLGKNKLMARMPARGDALPRRLHVQTARMLYGGLLRSCGLVGDDGCLTAHGQCLAKRFAGTGMPQTTPAKIWTCERMPCLSGASQLEKKTLREALLEGEEGTRRNATLKAIGKTRLRGQHTSMVLADFLDSRAFSNSAAELVREAAVLELTALPCTKLFICLYQSGGKLAGEIPNHTMLQPYRVRDAIPDLLADVGAHLRRAAKLGGEKLPLGLNRLKQFLLERHRREKPDAPWVSENWTRLREGLAPGRINVHSRG